MMTRDATIVRRRSIAYAFTGAVFGLLFPLIAATVHLWLHNHVWTWSNGWQLYIAEPIHYVVDLAPLILGLCGWLLGRARELNTMLIHERAFLQQIIDSVGHGLSVVDQNQRFLIANRAFADILGKTEDQIIGKTPLEVVPSLDPTMLKQLIEQRQQGRSSKFVMAYQATDGTGKHLQIASVPRIQHNRVVGSVTSIADITELKTLQDQLAHERDFVTAIVDTVDSLVIVLDRDGRTVRFNQKCEQITGYTAQEVCNVPFWEIFLLPDELEAVKQAFMALRAGDFPGRFENYWRTKNGDRRLIVWTNTALLDEHGNVEFVIGTGIDVTEQRKLEYERMQLIQQLQQQATTDALTGIANRRQFFATATSTIQQAVPADRPTSLILLDIDHFKRINDTYGHGIGDEILQMVVQRCRKALRDSDVLGRYGGEEFAVLLPDTPLYAARYVAERLCGNVDAQPFPTSIGPINVTISGGVVERTEHEHSVMALINRADQALYAAKHHGRNRMYMGQLSSSFHPIAAQQKGVDDEHPLPIIKQVKR